jgi:cytochrome bd-type quinol oxidase subunit 2
VLLSFLLLALASVAAIFRPRSDMPTDAYNLGRSLAVVWLLSLMLATPAIVPPLGDVYSSAPPWVIAAIILAVVTVGFAIYSFSRPKNRSTTWIAMVLPALFVGVVSWFFFWSMIMDDSTNLFLENCAGKIAEVFGLKR